jgi:peptidoglycan/xylan/chitin deacetylase (PgdA/CDA1 family)
MKKQVRIAFAVLAVVAVGFFTVTPHLLPATLSYFRPDIHFSIPSKEKKLFITIDDAPSVNTPQILRVLKRHDVPATFFVIADRVETLDQIKQIVAENHTLGNHLKTTKACSKLSLSEFGNDFEACAKLIESVEKRGRFFRPSSGVGSREQTSFARSRGYQTVLGTVFPLDHWISSPRWLMWLVRWLSFDGGILILHDGNIRGETTAEVLDRLIPRLKNSGYTFGRLEDDLGSEGRRAGGESKP